jgi:OmpA family
MRRYLLVGASLLALAAPAARAQQQPVESATSGQVEPGRFLVFFDFDRATLRPDARQTIAEAAQEYQRTGAARIAVTGHTDLSGSDSYNAALSERRAQAVRRELVRLGVPASAITEVAEGESEPLVQTADGAREARNRRVEIELPRPAAAAPATAAAEAASPPASTEPGPRLAEGGATDRFSFTLGPVYGHNFKEADGGTENDLIGAELVFNALPGFLGGVALKQGAFWSFNGEDDGLTGRSVLAIGIAPDLGFIRPRLDLNAGGVYGQGVQDGFVAGPELAVDVNLPGGFTLRPKVAYDYQFRNSGLDEGILWGGLDLGVRF